MRSGPVNKAFNPFEVPFHLAIHGILTTSAACFPDVYVGNLILLAYSFVYKTPTLSDGGVGDII